MGRTRGQLMGLVLVALLATAGSARADGTKDATNFFGTIHELEGKRVTELEGSYAQLGWFPHAAWSWVPRPLETAIRYASVDPDTSREEDLRREWTLGFNWFFAGHRNKLTLELSRLHDRAAEPGKRWETRLRLQWDVSF